MVPVMGQRDYYEVLGAGRSATPQQIKDAYRRLARKFHPDVNKAADAAEKFKEATAAYEVLADPKKRKLYDQFGHAGVGGAPFAGAGPAGRGRVRWSDKGVSFEDLFAASPFSSMGLDDLLSSLGGFGRRRPKRRTGRAAKGANIEHPLELDFIQAVRGCTTRLEINRGGSKERIDVKIPPGVHTGSRVRVRGKGRQGRGGSGDLYIITHVREHPYFRRVGADIYVDLPIGVTEAALGAEVTVPTVDGPATVKIPAGTSGGTRLRLRGKGAADPKTNSRGDQYVVLKIVLPKTFSPEARRLLGELAETDPYDPRKKVRW